MTPHSRAQLNRMLDAFSAADGPELFDIGALDHASKMMLLRDDWDRPQVERATRWIAGCNARGSSIYIRPARSLDTHPWVLVDDLDARALAALRADHPPGIVVETSSTNFQAWCRISRAIQTETRTSIARTLMSTYGGDPGGVGGAQFGRMPGTTNQKPDRRLANGQAPFAVLRHTSPQVATGIEIPAPAGPGSHTGADGPHREPNARTASSDQSAKDFALACRMVEAGHDDETVANAVQTARRRLGDPKAERVEYIDRTVWAARRRVEAEETT